MAKNKVIIELIAKDEATSKFLGSTKKIEGSLKTLDATGTKSLGSVSGGISKLQANWVKLMGAMAGIYVVVRAVKALWDMFEVTAALGDQIAKFSKQIGISVESLSALQYAGQITGIEVTALTKALRYMMKGAAEADQGLGEAKDTFEALGINVKEFKKLSPEQMLYALARAFKGVVIEADRVNYAMDIFGMRGAATLVLIEEGEDGIRKLVAEAHKMGAIFTPEQAAAAEEFVDATARMDTAVMSLKKNLTGTTMGPLTDFINSISVLVAQLGKAIEGVGKLSDWTGGRLATAFRTATAALPGMSVFSLMSYFGGFAGEKKEEGLPAGAGGPPVPESVFQPPRTVQDKSAEGLANKQLQAFIKTYRSILKSGEVTTEQLAGMWDKYRDKRLEQINLESQALGALTGDADLVEAHVSTQLKELEKEIEKLRAKYGEFRSPLQQAQLDVPTMEGALRSGAVPEGQKKALWGEYEEKKLTMIDKEIAKMKEVQNSEAAIKAKREQLTSELYDFKRQVFTKSADDEIGMLEKILSSDVLTKEERKRVWQDYYSMQIEKIKQIGAEMKRLGREVAVVDKWIATETKQLTKTMSQETNEWVKITNDFSSALSTSLSSGLFDLFKQGTDSMEDRWKAFLEMMVDTWMRASAQMLANQLFFGGEGGSGGIMGFLQGWLSSGSTGTTTPPATAQEGGIFTKPTFALIGDTPEAVIPLSKMPWLSKEMGRSGAKQKPPVNVYFNISTPDVRGFKMSEGQLMSNAAMQLKKAYRNL